MRMFIVVQTAHQASRVLTLGVLLGNFWLGCSVKSTVRWHLNLGRDHAWKSASVKSFDAWGFVEQFLIVAAVSKGRFAGTLLSVELVRKNRQASRLLVIGVSCDVS